MSELGKDFFVRFFWRASVAMALLLVFVGCAAGRDPKPTVAPTPALPPLQPPDFILKAKSGDQTAVPGTYFWVAANGMAADVKVEGIPVENVKPISVTAKENVTIDVQGGPRPESLEVRLYPKDGNFEKNPAPGANVDRFKLKTEPVWSRTFPTGTYTLSIDAPKSGDYYIWLKGMWPDSFAPDKPLTAEKAIVLQVK